ncbi:MAG: ABC transporter substrate-binding protein [Gemmatimonadota bacterium]|nr:ABC transporter substrate-binding protein [Gemmatimonadota bacterium]
MIFRLFCITCLLFLSCSKSQDPIDRETVKIGFLVSGDRTSYADAARLAVNEINTRGGLLDNRTVELVTRTNIQDALAAVQAAQQMIRNDEVFALLGPNRSTHAVEVGPIAQRAQVPMITTTATNPSVTRAGDFVFMAAFTDQFQGAVLARFAWEELGVSSAAVLTLEGDVYTEGISMFFVSHFRELGGTVVANELYAHGDTVFAEQLGRISEATPEAFFISGLVSDVTRVVRQTRTTPVLNPQGEPVTLLGADAWDNPVFLNAVPAEVEGSYFSGHFSAESTEQGAWEFVVAYEAAYDRTPAGGDAVSYDAVRLLSNAVERAGSFDGEAVRDRLAATRDYRGATRIARYNDNRHPTKSAVILTVKGGERRFFREIEPVGLGESVR